MLICAIEILNIIHYYYEITIIDMTSRIEHN